MNGKGALASELVRGCVTDFVLQFYGILMLKPQAQMPQSYEPIFLWPKH